MDKIHVHTPNSFIFVCGGRTDITAQIPASFRDLLLRLDAEESISNAELIKAEDLNAFFPKGSYSDLLKFEQDIAQISKLILLFSESYGSASELGAFAVTEEIATRLLVVIDNKNYSDDSFVTLGPLRVLEHDYSPNAVCVLDGQYLGFQDIRDLKEIDKDKFRDALKESIIRRVEEIPDKSTFNSDKPGHVIRLAIALIQHFGAMEISEIRICLKDLGICIDKTQLLNYLLCAEFAKWIKQKRIGARTLFIAITRKKSASFGFKSGVKARKLDIEAAVRDYWKEKDKERFFLISQAVAEMTDA